MTPYKLIPNMQRSENKSYLAATRGDRASSHVNLEDLHQNSAPAGNEAFYRWWRNKKLYMIHFNLTKIPKVRELALEDTTLFEDYEESSYN